MMRLLACRVAAAGICALLYAGCVGIPGQYGVGGKQHDRLRSTASVSPMLVGRNSLAVAVPDFSQDYTETKSDGLSTYIPHVDSGKRGADLFATRMLTLPSYRLIERNELTRVLAELKLQMSDLTNPSNVKEAGRLIGADALVLGRCSGYSWNNRYGWGAHVNTALRLVDVESGQVLFAVEGSIVRINSTDDVYPILFDDVVSTLDRQIEATKQGSKQPPTTPRTLP